MFYILQLNSIIGIAQYIKGILHNAHTLYKMPGHCKKNDQIVYFVRNIYIV